MMIGSPVVGSASIRSVPSALDKPTLPTAGTASASPSASFYPSPVYHLDPLAKTTVVEFRDRSTGAVTDQIPSAKVVAQYQKQGGAAEVSSGQKPTASAASGVTGSNGVNRTGGATATPIPTSAVSVAAPVATPPSPAVAAPSARVSVHT